jgi:hypothetical protein
MNDTQSKQKAVVLWVSGLAYSDISAMAEVEALVGRGVKVELLPSLITGTQSEYYQVMSGTAPASFGFFDTLMPAYQLSRPLNGQSGYSIVEENVGRDAAPGFFPDILRSAGWSVEWLEAPLGELVEKTRASLNATWLPACKIIRIGLDQQTLTASEAASLADIMHLARAWAGENGLLALLCDAPRTTIKRYVNLNNFLSEMGLIERDEQDGSIDWSNSLAYFAGHGQLWVNLLGREPQGAVHPQDEYAEVRDSLIQALPVRLRDSVTGEQVVERVYRKDEIYDGNYLFCAPDLVVQLMPGYAPSRRSARLEFDEQIFTEPSAQVSERAGMHPQQMRGCLLAAAPSLRVNASLSEPVAFTAFAPTLLHALGVEYSGMDSAAVEAMFSPAYLEAYPIRSEKRSDELSEEDEELVIGRLRDLGYI